MNTAYLLIGGNIGNREFYLQNALERLQKQVGKILTTSSLYETAAWGNTSLSPFLNQALSIQTQLSATELLLVLLQIELQMGRTRTEVWSARTIDIDILFFNKEIIETPSLQVPHPRICERNFVLQPLAEIAPFYIHPDKKQTVTELLKICTDELPVQKYTPKG